MTPEQKQRAKEICEGIRRWSESAAAMVSQGGTALEYEALGAARSRLQDIDESFTAALAHIERLETEMRSFAEMVECESRQREQDRRGGQHVTNTGDLCSAPTSVLIRMERWARDFRSLLAPKDSK